MNEIINFTNSRDYYGRIDLKSLNFNALKFELTIDIIIHDDIEDYKYERKIIANNVLAYENFNQVTLLPYKKINIYDNHPLINKFTEQEYVIKFNKEPNNQYNFLGKLHSLLENKSYHWLQLKGLFWNIDNQLTKSTKVRIPKYLIKDFSELCIHENILIEIEEIIQSQHSDLKLLMIGNEIVSPDNYSFGQPYILAKTFSIIKK